MLYEAMSFISKHLKIRIRWMLIPIAYLSRLARPETRVGTNVAVKKLFKVHTLENYNVENAPGSLPAYCGSSQSSSAYIIGFLSYFSTQCVVVLGPNRPKLPPAAAAVASSSLFFLDAVYS